MIAATHAISRSTTDQICTTSQLVGSRPESDFAKAEESMATITGMWVDLVAQVFAPLTNLPLLASGVSMTEESHRDLRFSSCATAEGMSRMAKRCLLVREIKSYADLPLDWDCDNGHAPSKIDIDNAVAFLWSLQGGKVPRPMVAGDGDVGFIWRTESSYLEVGFCDKGQISFYGKTSDGDKKHGDHDFAKEGVPDNLRKMLEKIANVPRIP